MARVAWRGPSALDRYGMTSIGVLMEYLAETSVAPIQRELVEVCTCMGVGLFPSCVHVHVCVLAGFHLRECVGWGRETFPPNCPTQSTKESDIASLPEFWAIFPH